jgi:hypothetical protein
MAQAEAARASWEREQVAWTARTELLQSRLRQLAGQEDELHCFREVVQRTLPPEAVVAVVSEGDDRLVHLDRRTAWHFPRTPDGAYAGYPATSADVIAALQTVRDQGANYLLVPSPRQGWLDLYPEFRQFLESRFERVPDVGPASALRNFTARVVRKSRRLWRELRGQPSNQAVPSGPCQIFDLWDLKRAPEEADGGRREASR